MIISVPRTANCATNHTSRMLPVVEYCVATTVCIPQMREWSPTFPRSQDTIPIRMIWPWTNFCWFRSHFFPPLRVFLSGCTCIFHKRCSTIHFSSASLRWFLLSNNCGNACKSYFWFQRGRARGSAWIIVKYFPSALRALGCASKHPAIQSGATFSPRLFSVVPWAGEQIGFQWPYVARERVLSI